MSDLSFNVGNLPLVTDTRFVTSEAATQYGLPKSEIQIVNTYVQDPNMRAVVVPTATTQKRQINGFTPENYKGITMQVDPDLPADQRATWPLSQSQGVSKVAAAPVPSSPAPISGGTRITQDTVAALTNLAVQTQQVANQRDTLDSRIGLQAPTNYTAPAAPTETVVFKLDRLSLPVKYHEVIVRQPSNPQEVALFITVWDQTCTTYAEPPTWEANSEGNPYIIRFGPLQFEAAYLGLKFTSQNRVYTLFIVDVQTIRQVAS